MYSLLLMPLRPPSWTVPTPESTHSGFRYTRYYFDPKMRTLLFGKLNPERRSLAVRRPHSDPAAVAFDDSPAEGQPDPQSFLVAALLQTLEHAEDPFLVRRSDADPVVRHLDADPVAVDLPAPDPDCGR